MDRHVFETDPELGSHVLAVLNRIGQQSGPDLAKRLKLAGVSGCVISAVAPGRMQLRSARCIPTCMRLFSTFRKR